MKMNVTSKGRLTKRRHWDEAWARPIRMRLPSPLLIETRDKMKLLCSHVQRGMRYLEIGCAPCKLLAWVAVRHQAEVVGLDYSPTGIETCKKLFASLGLGGEFHCEDLFAASLPDASFDFVFSNGVIEHFERPEEVVKVHWTLLKPGGKALIMIPNYHYRSIYGWLERFFNPDGLGLHNLEIMTPIKLLELVSELPVSDASSYMYGRMSPSLVSWHNKLPGPIVMVLKYTLMALAHFQPVTVDRIASFIVLEFRRRD